MLSFLILLDRSFRGVGIPIAGILRESDRVALYQRQRHSRHILTIRHTKIKYLVNTRYIFPFHRLDSRLYTRLWRDQADYPSASHPGDSILYISRMCSIYPYVNYTTFQISNKNSTETRTTDNFDEMRPE